MRPPASHWPEVTGSRRASTRKATSRSTTASPSSAATASTGWRKGRGLDFSAAGGLHWRRGDRTADIWGIDLTFLASKHLAPKFELYGGIDFGFEKVENSGSYQTVHLAPGIEYRLSPDLDLVSEFGIGLNRDSRHYFAIGLAFYVR